MWTHISWATLPYMGYHLIHLIVQACSASPTSTSAPPLLPPSAHTDYILFPPFPSPPCFLSCLPPSSPRGRGPAAVTELLYVYLLQMYVCCTCLFVRPRGALDVYRSFVAPPRVVRVVPKFPTGCRFQRVARFVRFTYTYTVLIHYTSDAGYSI